MDIQWHVVTDLDSARKDAAEARIRKLGQGQKDLIHVVVHVEGSNHHQHGAAEAKIRCQARSISSALSKRCLGFRRNEVAKKRVIPSRTEGSKASERILASQSSSSGEVCPSPHSGNAPVAIW